MIHVIPLILGYVGGDLSTPFAREHLSKMEGKLAGNSDGPMCLLLENKRLYMTYSYSRLLFENGYFTTELLRRIYPDPTSSFWTTVFMFPHIPSEFIQEERKNRKDFWHYPLIPLDELKKKAEVTKSASICEYILSNPAFFLEGIGRAEEVVKIIVARGIVLETKMKVNLSCNTGALAGFFLRNPKYISHTNLAGNSGQVFRGDEQKVLTLLERESKSLLGECRWIFVQNPAVPLKFFESVVDKFDGPTLGFLSVNSSVTLPWWHIHVEKLRMSENLLGGFAPKESTPHSFILQHVQEYTPAARNSVLASSYNIPLDEIMEMCRMNSDAMDWDSLALNRGFWLHLAERELTPILQDFFNVSPLQK